MYKLLYGVVLLSLFAGSHTMFWDRKDFKDGPGYIEIASNLSAGIVEIVQKSIIESRQKNSFNMYSFVQRPERQLLFGDIMEYILTALAGNISVRIGVGAPVPGDHERHYNVLLVDSAESLKVIYTEFKRYNLNADGYFIIVLHTFDSAHYYDIVFEIFELNWTLGIIDANVLVYALTNLSLLYNIQPFNEFHCKGLAPTIENRFTNSRWQHSNFYPDKLLNLHGCASFCAIRKEMPYLDVDGEGNALDGVEGKLLEYMARRMNFSFQFRSLSEDEITHILDNKADIFDEIFAGGTDFAVGSFRFKLPKDDAPYKMTDIYFLNHYAFIINSNLYSYSPIDKIFLPFNSDIWSLLVLIQFGVFVLNLITKIVGQTVTHFIFGEENRMPMFNMMSVSMGMGLSLQQMPKRNFARYLLMLYILLTFLMRNSYQAFLFDFIKSNMGRPPPKKIDDLLQQNYQLVMSETVFRVVSDLPLITSRARILNMSLLESIDLVRKSKELIAVLAPIPVFAYFHHNNSTFYNGIHVVEERVFAQRLSFYMAPNSMLLRRFNYIISTYIDEGLFRMWNRYFLNINFRIRNEESPAAVLTIDQLDGAFYVWLMGSGVAVLVLFVEIIFQLFLYTARSTT